MEIEIHQMSLMYGFSEAIVQLVKIVRVGSGFGCIRSVVSV